MQPKLRRMALFTTLAMAAGAYIVALPTMTQARPVDADTGLPAPPAPKPAQRPKKPAVAPAVTEPQVSPQQRAKAAAERLKRIGAAKSWGYQLTGLDIAAAAASPFDLMVVDAATGLKSGKPMRPEEIEQLKKKPDGTRRLVISYLSIGEAEDYRQDYFAAEYLTEDAPDWLLQENQVWKGNRLIRFCSEGWQKTILGDDNGRNYYNEIQLSPLYELIERGVDGVYLDRVDVYSEVGKECPDAERKMIEFVARLAAHGRKKNPGFMVIMQNAEELLRHQKVVDTIDAVAKEDLFYGSDHTENANSPQQVADVIANLKRAKQAGRPVFVVDYLKDKARIAEAKKKIEAQGFVPYIGPRDLASLWLPGTDF